MKLNELKSLAKRKKRKRLGRGDASGHGGTSTKGHKGQKARAGGFHKTGFEGGQMPLIRRLPKRGFVNIFKRKWGIVNLERLAALKSGTEVTLELVKEKGWIPGWSSGFKVLSKGELKHPLSVKANQISASALEKLKKLGGTFETVGGPSVRGPSARGR